MTATWIDLDDEALAEAMRMLGISSAGDTVNAVLREYVTRVKRIEALEKPAVLRVRTEVMRRDVRMA
ncbi:type II toxin-antitoxin system VapB family antitoxin [Streptosporangium canum]|uniref:type II toxin-antitoxin system VapB family antitoxin n=1 Tax=Streptosporangium canum TaxID=324952 RepID=UPI003424B762